MKRAFLISLLFAMSFFTAAQDTVRYLDPWYAFEERGLLLDSAHCTMNHSATGEEENYTLGFIDSYYADWLKPVANKNKHQKLYGIAVTVKDTNAVGYATDYLTIILHAYFGVTLTPIYPGYFEWTHNQKETLVASSSPLAGSDRSNNIKECLFEYEYDYPAPSSSFAHCYEFYFDQPISIATEDTFYVGIVSNYGSFGLYPAWDSLELSKFNVLTRVSDPYAPYPYTYSETNFLFYHWGGIFPIVELRCTAPRGFRLCDEVAPTACWRGDTNATVFQVSVCNSLIEPELGSLATTSDTAYDLSYLHPDSAYLVYLRKMCSFVCADTVWSDWSGPIVLGDTTGWAANGAGIVETAATEVTLTPNPAADHVTVAAEGMERVELIGVDGAVLLRRECRGECQIDLKGLAAGVYMVRVATSYGTATRRLVVR